MKPTVYVETTVVSYVTAKLSRDLIIAGHQQITQEWWEKYLPSFDAYIYQSLLFKKQKKETVKLFKEERKR